MATGAQSSVVKTEMVKPNLAIMEKSPRQGGLHNKKTDSRNVSWESFAPARQAN
jgi:hypothetical protein